MIFKERLKEIKQQDAEYSLAPTMFDPSKVKVEINNLLHMFMPPTASLGEVDQFALAILDTIREAWDEMRRMRVTGTK